MKQLGFTVAAVILGLLLIEGASRVALVAIDRRGELTERKHTKYDAELGWVNVPSKTVKDLYGPGRSLTINAQGFRGKREYAKTPPSGVARLLCSGDSFTLGWGVDDDDTWCARLERENPALEVVNMGQGGYGIDQAYLWWRRDGGSIAYDVHVFAIIYEDFHRMRFDRFQGYGKPTLKLENGVPLADRIPVPRPRRRLATAELIGRLTGRRAASAEDPKLDALAAGELAVRAVAAMREGNAARGARLVVVWLPTLDQHRPSELDRLRVQFLGRVRALGVDAIDLVEDFRHVPPSDVDAMFLIEPSGGGRHFSELGHEFVAARLGERLADFLDRRRHGS